MPAKILIVDDGADFRTLLAIALAPLAEIVEAADGPEALRKIASDKPKLMLLDVSMPEMGGLAVLKKARALDPKLVVVMLTGESDLSVAKKAVELGARAFITKPFDVDAVLGELRRLLA